MPRIVSPGLSKLLLLLTVVVLLFGFVPISRVFLRSVDGSFSPVPYSSLALKARPGAAMGIPVGRRVAVQLTNKTGHEKTYQWSARQGGTLISLGEDTVDSGRTSVILVPSKGAVVGRLRIALRGSRVFVTVPLVGS